MLRLFKNFLLSLIAVFPLLSQSVESISVEGNFTFDDSEILEWSGLRKGVEITPGLQDSAISRISLMLNNNGYVDNHCEMTLMPGQDSSKTKLLIKVTEGDGYLINRIKITGADSIPVKSFSGFQFLEGQIFNKYELEEQITQALVFLENNGYPFTKIRIASVSFYTDSLSGSKKADVMLSYEPGKINKIDEIEVTGNTKTKEDVIIRELRINQGEVYSQELVEELPKRLNRLRFFEPVAVPSYYLNSKNQGILKIDIKEKETNYFDGIVGYIPGTEGGEKGYLTGLVNVSLRNLFGTGRAAAVRWQKYDRLSQEMELRYLEPWIFSWPVNLSGGFFQRKQDSSYVQRRFDGTVEYLATESVTAAFFLQSENVIPAASLGNTFRVYNSLSTTTGVNLKFDTRDDPFAPTEGLLFQSLYSFSRKKIYGPAQFITPGMETHINLQRLTFDFSYFYSLFLTHVIAAGVHGRELKGSFFEESDLFRLGGTQTLRGYRENQFLGSRMLWTNLEYRLLLTRRTYAFVFFDTGYYLRKGEPDRNIEQIEDFKFGYGAGLNLETGLGVLVVSYALGEGDSFSNGKIHFGIVNEF